MYTFFERFRGHKLCHGLDGRKADLAFGRSAIGQPWGKEPRRSFKTKEGSSAS